MSQSCLLPSCPPTATPRLRGDWSIEWQEVNDQGQVTIEVFASPGALLQGKLQEALKPSDPELEQGGIRLDFR
ncbi:hypothetical protein WJX73_002478 [Symbiochloris irregularis]|uniref:Uncharacterized protein n=1 Tax=Symbiochloris irregularis TaxID=706552 RepID=A0AAW1NQX6_9CHLO